MLHVQLLVALMMHPRKSYAAYVQTTAESKHVVKQAPVTVDDTVLNLAFSANSRSPANFHCHSL